VPERSYGPGGRHRPARTAQGVLLPHDPEPELGPIGKNSN